MLAYISSDGGGRSGVYLAIDANMELAEEEDCFHVFGYLKKLRQSRKGLIENVVSTYILKFKLCMFSLRHIKLNYTGEHVNTKETFNWIKLTSLLKFCSEHYSPLPF